MYLLIPFIMVHFLLWFVIFEWVFIFSLTIFLPRWIPFLLYYRSPKEQFCFTSIGHRWEFTCPGSVFTFLIYQLRIHVCTWRMNLYAIPGHGVSPEFQFLIGFFFFFLIRNIKEIGFHVISWDLWCFLIHLTNWAALRGSQLFAGACFSLTCAYSHISYPVWTLKS